MNSKELKIESLQIEDNIQERIDVERWKNELMLIRICLSILVFMIFIFTPIYFLFAPQASTDVLVVGYSLLFIVCAIGIIYYLIGYKFLSKNPKTLNIFRAVDITMEAVIISCVFFV